MSDTLSLKISSNLAKPGVSTGKVSVLTLLCAAAICKDFFLIYFRIFVSLIPGIGDTLAPFVYPVIFSSLAIAAFIKKKLKGIRPIDVVFILIVYGLIYLSYLRHPENRQFINEQIGFILRAIPYFFIGLVFDFSRQTHSFISRACVLCIYIRLIYTLLLIAIGRPMNGEHMDYAYVMILCVLVAINYSFEKRGFLIKLSVVLGFLLIAMTGTRGPLVIAVVFFAICVFWKNWCPLPKKTLIILLLLLLIFALFGLGLLSQLARFLSNLFYSLGLSTRIFDAFLNSSFLSDTSSRDFIAKVLMGDLEANSFNGFGFYAEWRYGFYSAHNMYIELMFHVGLGWGVALITCYVLLYFWALRKAPSYICLSWLVIFGCYVFVKGFFGGRYVSDISFALLGLCLNACRKRKANSNQIIWR